MEDKETQPVVSDYTKKPLLSRRVVMLILGVGAVLAVGGGIWYYLATRPVNEKYDTQKTYESIANTDTNISFGENVEKDQKIDYYIGEAWILREANKLTEARAMLQKGEELAQSGDYPLLYNAIGETLEAQGKPKEAETYYQRALDTLEKSNLNDKDAYKQAFNDNLKRVR